MYAWILVFWFPFGSGAVATIDGFVTEQQCMNKGKELAEKFDTPFARYHCIRRAE